MKLSLYSSLWLLQVFSGVTAQINITYPANALPGAFYVQDNFFGISFEMQIINTLIGNTSSTVPTPIQYYLGNIRNRTSNPLRLRVGGNSMDNSYYVPNQTVIIAGTVDNVYYSPAYFGPPLIDTIYALGNDIGGAIWDVGLGLIHLNDSANTVQLALYARNTLGTSLDSFLLGNEPDLYFQSGRRPGQANYTVQNYIDDYANVLGQMHAVSNLVTAPMAGPTICCSWDLNTVLTSGYIGAFQQYLKYITVQRYPQDNCIGLPPIYDMTYYTNHYNVIGLASIYYNGVQTAQQAGLNVSLTEFNSAACGGIAGLSNTFGVTLWTIDYVMQLASLGYSSAYIHTREAGIPYNLFDPPIPSVDPNTPGWTTGPPYHALLVVAEALHKLTSPVMSVVDLHLTSPLNTVAGYGIYPAPNATVARMPPSRFLLFNFANTGTATFYFTPNTTGINRAVGDIPVTVPGGSITVKYLLASDLTANLNISWAGQVVSGGGVLTGTPTNSTVTGCDGAGGSSCGIAVPGPGAALVFLDGEQDSLIAFQNITSATGLAGGDQGTTSTYTGPNYAPSVLNPSGGRMSLDRRRVWLGIILGLVLGVMVVI